MLGVSTLLRKKVLAVAVALALSMTVMTTTATTTAQAQDDAESQRTDEQSFDKWGQLLGLTGLAGLAGLALQRSDKGKDDQ